MEKGSTQAYRVSSVAHFQIMNCVKIFFISKPVKRAALFRKPHDTQNSVAERLTQERYNVSSSTQAAQASCYPKRSRRCAMESMKLWARDGEAVRQAIELGEIAHIETASEELTDEFLLFAIESGLLKTWANAFPDPRREPEIGMEVILPAHLAGRFAGLYSMRKAGYVLRSARVLGALGYSVEVIDPAHGLSLRGTSDDKLFSGDVVRKLVGPDGTT